VGRLRRTKEKRIPGDSHLPSPSVGLIDLFSKSQLKFNPTNPSILYASFRRSPRIYSWDLRGDTSTPFQEFQTSDFPLGEITNQKLMFDIDYTGRWLGVGDHVCIGSQLHFNSHIVSY
jgi:hypothetical protein